MEFEKLQEIIAEVLNLEPDDITMGATFVDDLGADSLDIFQIIMGIEEDFDIEIDNEEAEKITKDAGLDVYKMIEGIQPICFENACWAYTVGAAIAIKKGCKTAAEAAEIALKDAIPLEMNAYKIEMAKVMIRRFLGF